MNRNFPVKKRRQPQPFSASSCFSTKADRDRFVKWLGARFSETREGIWTVFGVDAGDLLITECSSLGLIKHDNGRWKPAKANKRSEYQEQHHD